MAQVSSLPVYTGVLPPLGEGCAGCCGCCTEMVQAARPKTSESTSNIVSKRFIRCSLYAGPDARIFT